MSTTAADAGPRPGARRAPGLSGRLSFYIRGLWRMLVVPALMLGGVGDAVTALAHKNERGFFDFKGGLYNAGVSILHGANPYRAAYLAHQAAIMHAGGIAIGETTKHTFSVPLYPAFANLAVIPLSALPFAWAALIYTLLSVGAMWLALRLLGVRDWRCHAMWLISWPFLFAAILGAIGPLLVLGVAMAWRWRARLWPPALAVATVVALKIFPWTLGVWLLMTRRFKTLALSVASGLVLTFGAWALIGFHGLAQYPEMLSNATYIQEGRADSIATVLLVLGLGPTLAQGLAILAGIAVLGLAWRMTRRPDGDRRAFGLAIIASLIATPIVWDHYMVLLFVPIALLSPRFSRLWLVPVITPALITISFVVFPNSSTPQAYSPDSLHWALGWLADSAVIAFYLCTTPERRVELKNSVSRALTRSGSSWATQWEAAGSRTTRSSAGTSRGSGSASSAPR